MGDISVPLCLVCPVPVISAPVYPAPVYPAPVYPAPVLFVSTMHGRLYISLRSFLFFRSEKSVQSYEKFLTCANKTQKIAVICVFLIIFIIFMSSFVHYLCPPPSISRAILLPALHPPFRLCSPSSIIYVLLRLSFGISFFCIRHAWRIGNAAFCIVFSFSPSLKGRVGGVFVLCAG